MLLYVEFQEKYNVFRSALEIPEPWYVFHHESDKEEKTLHIYIEYRKGAEFSCSNCGSPGCKVHDIQDQDRTWRHLDFWQYLTTLHARMPRVKLVNDALDKVWCQEQATQPELKHSRYIWLKN